MRAKEIASGAGGQGPGDRQQPVRRRQSEGGSSTPRVSSGPSGSFFGGWWEFRGHEFEPSGGDPRWTNLCFLVSTGKRFLERGRMRDCRRGPRGGQALALPGQGSMYSEGCAAQPTRRPAPLLWRRLLEQARQRRRWAVIGHHLGRGRQRARLAAQLEGQPRAGGNKRQETCHRHNQLAGG